MVSKERADEIKRLVFDTIGYKSDFEYELTETEGVFAQKKDGIVTVGGKTIPMLARAFFLTVLKEKKGENCYTIEEKAHFSRCGRLLDVSRNGVLRVDAFKRYINYMVTLGMNVIEKRLLIKNSPIWGLSPNWGKTKEVHCTSFSFY